MALVVFWGDIVLSDIVQFNDPKVTSLYDFDENKGTIIRTKALNDAVKNKYWVAVSHIDFPGIRHISKTDSAYKFVPVK